MLPPRRRTWPIVVGVALAASATSVCLFSLALAWDAPVPAGRDTHRIALEHGRLVIEQDTVNTPPASTGVRFRGAFDPGFSITYAETFTAPSARAKRIPVAMYLFPGVIAFVAYAFYHKKQPPGHCPECGYDLDGNAGPCPECGHSGA